MTGRTFVDTNIIVYAHDLSAGDKRVRAMEVIAGLWESEQGCVSVQVLQETYVTLTAKVPHPLPVGPAADLIADFGRWTVHAPDVTDVLGAIEIQSRDRLSFWDSMIVRSAARLGCETLLSEDLNPGQSYDGVIVRNPFVDLG